MTSVFQYRTTIILLRTLYSLSHFILSELKHAVQADSTKQAIVNWRFLVNMSQINAWPYVFVGSALTLSVFLVCKAIVNYMYMAAGTQRFDVCTYKVSTLDC